MYTGSLNQIGARIFFTAATLKNFKVYSVDVSNAFNEAPPPKTPLCVTIEKKFKERWASKGIKLLPGGSVLPV